MKKLLAAMFVALLMVGCGEGSKQPTEDSPESNESSAETPPAKTAEVAKIDLDDPETLDKIIAEAIDGNKLKKGGKDGEKLFYAPNEQTPYTGWVKSMHDNGQINWLWHYKDGKEDGQYTWWYPNGQKMQEGNHKDDKPWTAIAWKPNGEKCPVTKLIDGNGVVVSYNEDGKEESRYTFKDGELQF